MSHTEVKQDEQGYYAIIFVKERNYSRPEIARFQSRPTETVVNIRKRKYETSVNRAHRIITRVLKNKSFEIDHREKIAWKIIDSIVHSPHKCRVFNELFPRNRKKNNFLKIDWKRQAACARRENRRYSDIDYCRFCNKCGPLNVCHIFGIRVPSTDHNASGPYKYRAEYLMLCRICRNKMQPKIKAFNEYLTTRKAIKNAEKEIRKCQKSQPVAS